MVHFAPSRGKDTGANQLITFPYGFVDVEANKVRSIDISRLKYHPCTLGHCCKVGAASANESRAHDQYAAHHVSCHQVQEPAMSFMVACVLCDQVFAHVASLGRHVEHHAMLIGIDLYQENRSVCCDEAASDGAANDDVLSHIRKVHMPNRPYMCVACGITTSSFLALCM